MMKLCTFFILGFLVIALFRMPKVDDRNSKVAHKDILLTDISVEYASTMNGL